MADRQIKLNLKVPDLFRDKAYVNGKWTEAKSGKRFEVIDPGSNIPWATCTDAAAEDVEAAVEAAYAAFLAFRRQTPRQRAALLARWHALIAQHRDDLARIVVLETGKPLREALDEVDYAGSFARWFEAEAERVRGETFAPSTPGRRVFTIKQPLGVAAALVPWNFPLAMVMRKASAAFAAGCTMVVKPSPETPLSALSLALLAERAGFPPGVLNVLPTTLANTPALSEALCKHPKVKKVTFTGSTRVGKLVASHCAPSLKKVVLELGGNAPFLVFDDADLELAADTLMGLKFRHAGQACITANRVLVQAGVYDRFAQLLVQRCEALTVGHGMDPAARMGPLCTPQGLAKVADHVADAVAKGGRVLTGGRRVATEALKHGYFFEPTVIVEASDAMRVASEETFGPMVALWRFQTEDEAVRIANNTEMGLSAYYFTKDVNRTFRLLENLEAGMIGMNTGAGAAAESPFGGIKESGYGKESGKDVAINEYMITKVGTLTVQDHY